MVWLYRLYPALLDAILIVQPETVIRWYRRGFRAYWHWRSGQAGGRPRIDSQIRALILAAHTANQRESAVGRAADPRRIVDAGHRRRRINREPVCGSVPPPAHLKVGRLSRAIMPPVSLRWICLWCLQSRSSCSTVWRSYVTGIRDRPTGSRSPWSTEYL